MLGPDLQRCLVFDVLFSLLGFQHIDPLPPLDHSTVDYKPFSRNFYEEHADIAELTQERVAQLRKTLSVAVIM